VLGEFFRAGLWDRLLLFVAPVVVGAGGRPLFDIPTPARMADAPRVRLSSVQRVGGDILLTVYRKAEGD
jgi:diaminohydroxyphosphoribosylaminopyrimidine deaminase/5-amino-6-(5-phosphoribosylamino)uracil reductase